MSLPRLLTIMGSGETAPTMIKPHRRVFERLGVGSGHAVFLDTPFGFQENADELSAKTLEYFHDAIGVDLAVAGLRRTEGADAFTVEAALARVRAAHYVFAGPGSPTYALRQWAGTPLAGTLRDKLRNGGAVTFSSAAALTLGVRTVPVYEIYKVGMDPVWLDGLDVLSEIGLRAVVIPHYDNAEGGHHDTRFCYLGERRLAMLEPSLPDDVFVLGVDEHTGLLVDLDADRVDVVGRGTVTFRRAGRSTVLPAGETIDVATLCRGGEGRSAGTTSTGRAGGEAVSPDAAATPTGTDVVAGIASAGDTDADEAPAVSLAEETARQEAKFDAALEAGDATAAATAALALEVAIVAWSRDTLQSDEADRARAALRSMIVRLGGAAVAGLRDPRTVLAPVVEAALTLRRVVRSEKRYDLSDLLRDGLLAAGIEVRDTPDGAVWTLTDGPTG